MRSPNRYLFSGMRVRTRLLLVLAVPLVVAIGIGAVFVVGQSISDRGYRDALTWSDNALAVQAIQIEANDYREAVQHAANHDDPKHPEVDRTLINLRAAHQRSSELAHSLDEAEAAEDALMTQTLDRWIAQGQAVQVDTRRYDAFRDHYFSAVEPVLLERIEDELSSGRAMADRAHRLGWLTLAIGLSITLVLLVGGVAVGLLVERSITRPLGILEEHAHALTEGRRPTAIGMAANDEIGRLAGAFDAMSSRLDETMILRTELEGEVARRTAALETNLAELERTRVTLRHGEKLSVIGRLLAGIAHEINNPLAVIVGFADALDRRVPEGNALRMPVVSIAREARRCRELVQSLLTFSRASKPELAAVELNALIRATVPLLAVRAKAQHSRIELDLDDTAGMVSASQVALQQVLVNLGVNAFDAMPEGGTLTFRTRRDVGGLHLEVQDTGTGIPENLRDRVFEPFFTSKELGKGTGLGLSLSYEIIQQHGGTIDFASVVGRGTTMNIHLPQGSPS